MGETPQKPELEEWQQDTPETRRARRRSCVFKLLIMWFTIMAAVILVMIFIRSRVTREPDQIMDMVAQHMTFNPPEGFFPYRASRFAGSRAISFWDQRRLREDGRTTSVIAMYSRESWQDRPLEEVAAQALPDLEKRLDRNEFRANSKETRTIEREGRTVVVHVFRGMTKIDADYYEAVSCFLFLQSPTDIWQIQTLGLAESFDEEAQAEILSSIVARK